MVNPLSITLSLRLHFHMVAIGAATAFSTFQPSVAISATPVSNSFVSSHMYTQAAGTSLELCLRLHHRQSPTPCPCSLCCLHNVHVCPLSTSTPSPTCLCLAPAPLATYMTRACSFILPQLPCFLQPLSVLVGLLQLCVSPYLLHLPLLFTCIASCVHAYVPSVLPLRLAF